LQELRQFTRYIIMRHFRFSLLTCLIASVMASGALWMNLTPWGEKVFRGSQPHEFVLNWTRGFPFAFDRWTDQHLATSAVHLDVIGLNLFLCTAVIGGLCYAFERLAAAPRAKRLIPLAAAVLLGLTGFCCTRIPHLDYPTELPAAWDEKVDPVMNALQLWRLGPAFVTSDEMIPGMTAEQPLLQARNHYDDPYLRGFLEYPKLAPAVQFSCASSGTPIESSLKDLIKSSDPVLRLETLAILLRVHSPSSVREQWDALQALQKFDRDPLWRAVVADFARCFEPNYVTAMIARPPATDRYSGRPFDYIRAIRVAGVIQCKAGLPRLIELSRCEHLDTSLAAELSLEDFPGADGDDALTQCITGWKYDGYVRACRALGKRNRTLLAKTLLNNPIPDGCAYLAGEALAECDDPAAVPLICKSVARVAIIDRKLFAHVGRLATAEQLPLVLALPGHVRDNQQDYAAKTIAEVLQRLGIDPEKAKQMTTLPHPEKAVENSDQ
jgi:hypothetical protein